MKKNFSATVNEGFEFDLSEEEKIPFSRVDKDGIHALTNGNSITGHLIESDFLNREYSFRINGTRYDVRIKNELQLLIGKLGLAAGAVSVSNELKAPIPGLITEVLAAEGATVKKGDGLLILEAMKMENKLLATQDAVIKKIAIKKGDTVDKGMMLIEFEDNEEHS